jgi:DNA-binding transcriptional LysR family regulator
MIGKSDQLASGRLRLSLRQLEVFVATAQGGSTRAGADRVARSQSAASSALAELEDALGAKVFDRIGRRLVLNENGRALLPRAQAILEQSTEAQALFEAEHTAPLRVAASYTIGEYLLPRQVAQWTALHPQSHVRLQIANTSDVIDAVAAFNVDVGFIEGTQTHSDLIVRPWLDDELVIIAAPRHPLAKQIASLRQLADASWVMREPGSGTRQAADAWLLPHLRDVDVRFELGSTEAVKGVVAAGPSLGCVSRFTITHDLAERRLVVLRTRLPKATRKLAVVLHRQRQLGRVTADFLAHCGAAAAAARPR